MALLTTQTADPNAPAAVTYSAASAGGDTMQPGAALHVKNASGAPITVTITSQVKCNQGVQHDVVVTVPAGSDRLIGPLPASRFASPTTGLVAIAYSAVASVTVAAISDGYVSS